MKKILKLLFVSFCLFGLLGCGTPASQKALEKNLELIRSENIEGLSKKERSFLPIVRRSTYKIQEVREKGDKSEIDMVIHTIDLSKYIGEYVQFMLPTLFLSLNENIVFDRETKFFDELSSRKDLSYIDIPITVYLEKREKQWVIINEKVLYYTLFGGLDKGLEKAVKDFLKETFSEVGKVFSN